MVSASYEINVALRVVESSFVSRGSGDIGHEHGSNTGKKGIEAERNWQHLVHGTVQSATCG